MIIHSIVPLETILKSDIHDSNHDSNNEIIDYGQIKLEVRVLENKKYEVVRIISTDPGDYLKDCIKPGSMLNVHYHPGE